MAKLVEVFTTATATIHEKWVLVVPDDVDVTVDNWQDAIAGRLPNLLVSVTNEDVTDEHDRDLDQIGPDQEADEGQSKALDEYIKTHPKEDA